MNLKDVKKYNINTKDIQKVAKRLHVKKNQLKLYGNNVAKIDFESFWKTADKRIAKANENIDKNKNYKLKKHIKEGNVVLVTAMTPNKKGEGKTTTTIGLADSLFALTNSACGVLREPSLGPVFGAKGGAAGDGKASLVNPMDVNLHFTSDMHAITAANNLIVATIENNVFYNTDLDIDINSICINRCIDANDRGLRNIIIENSKYSYKASFDITPASPIMAILVLAKDKEDFKNMVSRLVVAKTNSGKDVTVEDLGIVNAIMLLMNDALNPNLTTTIYNTPMLVHGGPFANIATGCNSIIATKTAQKMFDYVVTEAGFGADLGAQKFLDIKCRNANIVPKAIVMVVSLRSLKEFESYEIGLANLEKHYNNLKEYIPNVLVAINVFAQDDKKELEKLEEYLESKGIPVYRSESYQKGRKGAYNLAKAVVKSIKEQDQYNLENNIEEKINFVYDKSDDFYTKLNKLNKRIYKADNIVVLKEAKEFVENNKKKIDAMDICIAKSPYAFTDDDTQKETTLTVTDVKFNEGADFAIVYCSKIMTMPGLGKDPNALKF